MTRSELIAMTRRYLDGARVQCINNAIHSGGGEDWAERAVYWKGLVDRIDAAGSELEAVAVIRQIEQEIAAAHRARRAGR